MKPALTLQAIALATFGLILTAGGVFAADLPTRKGPPALPPPPPPPPLWTGFYAGLNIGYSAGANSNVSSVSTDPYENFAYQLVNVERYTGTDKKTYSYPVFGKKVLSGPSGAGAALSGILGGTPSSFGNTQNGVIGGGQIGYNYQWGPNIVFGVEADIQGTGIRGTSRGIGGSLDPVVDGGLYGVSQVASRTFKGKGDTDTWTQVVSLTSNGATTVNAGVNWLGTVRGRFGYLWTPTLLFYATGGLTYGGVYANVHNSADINVTNTITAKTAKGVTADPRFLINSAFDQYYTGAGSKTQTLFGWNVGGGVEWLFAPNWSVKAEGIYWNLGNVNVPTYSVAPSVLPSSSSNFIGTVPNASYGNTRVNYQGVIARAGVNYHFIWGASAPVVAKY